MRSAPGWRSAPSVLLDMEILMLMHLSLGVCLPLDAELLESSGYVRFISVLLKPSRGLAQKKNSMSDE